MALANTTFNAACTATDSSITLAATTSLGPGMYLNAGGEIMQITRGFVAGTAATIPIPVLRGQEGTVAIAHANTEQVSAYVLPSDIPSPSPGTPILQPLAGRARFVTSIAASAAYTPQSGNQDELVVLDGTSVIALTLTNPTRDQTGKVVIFAGNGIAAHTITYTTVGFGNVGATADVVTFGTTQAQTFSMIAVGGFWLILGALSTATANVSGPAVA